MLTVRVTGQRLRRGLLAALLMTLAACGGGGGGGAPAAGNTPPPAPTPEPTPAPAPISSSDLNSASRFATRATFGLPYAEIERLAEQGSDSWLEAQLATPPTFHMPLIESLVSRREGGEFEAFEEDVELLISFRRYVWWHRAMTAPDQLRQRVAFALSQIFVVSDNVDLLIIDPAALGTYQDMLLTHAFGNFRDLLEAVTLHPAMGLYLSHLNNRRSNPAANIFPDENYAREVMQLFSIGLYELNLDGSRRLDGDGDPIPTYDNDDIREFAKIFTGLSYGGPGSFFGRQLPYYREPMRMFDAFHEPGQKQLLNGAIVPAGLSGSEDIDAAMDNLFNHPNIGPFFGRLLIQRLVTSNPTPAYVERVARAFNDNGTGVRGDLAAVIRAVLEDPEAVADPAPGGNGGKLREPVLRYLALMRQLNAESSDGFFFNAGFFVQQLVGQHPFSSPSVFNFYLPDHSPSGDIAGRELVAPEFQITNTTTVVGVTNLVDITVNGGFVMDAMPPFGEVSLDVSEYVALADDVEALLDRLDTVFTYGTLDPATRSAMTSVLTDIADLEFRANTAIYLMLISPDYAVEL